MTELAAPAAESAPATLMQMASGYQLTQLLSVAATLRIADLLAGGPRSSDDLATASGTHPSALYRLLRALAGYGIFAEGEANFFALTPLAEPLRSDVPGSVRDNVMVMGQQSYRLWGDLLYSVQTGEAAFEHLTGVSAWQYFAEHPGENAWFNGFMARQAGQRGRLLAAAHRFADGATVADIGGGNGALLATILQTNGSLRGVLLDQPHVVAAAPATLAAAGVADRCVVEAGDFFESAPAADVYVLSTVLHDWDDEQALRILRRCGAAARPHATLVLVEQVVPTGNGPHPSKVLDLAMLLMNRGGRERTADEWGALLLQAGFELQRIVRTRAPECVLVARLADAPI